jgi:uncharacterized protein DUF4388
MSQSAEREPTMNTASDKPRSALSGFTARVDGAHLADLIQMNCQKRSRCVFRIISGEQSGYLFFDDGLVLHATFGAETGMDAVTSMLGLDTGTFEPSDLEWPATGSLKLPADVLLLTAAKRLDEARSAAERQSTPDSAVVKLPSMAPSTLRNGPRSNHPTPQMQRRASAAPSKLPPSVSANDSAPDSLSPPSSGVSLPMVHLSKTGDLIASKGEASESLVEATAFTHRLACLAGEALGLGPCRAIYMTNVQRGLIVFQARADAVVGATGSLEQLGYLVKKAGL